MKRKTFWILIGIGVLLVFLFIFMSNVIDVGEKLRQIHVYVEYAFYGLSALLMYFLILNPLRVILFAPTFSVESIVDEDKNYKIYKKAAKVLLENDELTDDDRVLIKSALGNKTKLREALKSVFEGTIQHKINETIVENAKAALVSTAISQNGNLDQISVIVINLRLIKEIVRLSGFRPSYANLGKLSVNVLVTSVIAEGLEDLDLNELLPTKLTETLTDLPFVKTLSSSVIQGVSNGLLTARVGIVTSKYLFSDNKLLTRKEIRRMAYKESFKLMPRIITEGLSIFPKSVVNIMSKPFKKKSKKQTELAEDLS